MDGHVFLSSWFFDLRLDAMRVLIWNWLERMMRSSDWSTYNNILVIISEYWVVVYMTATAAPWLNYGKLLNFLSTTENSKTLPFWKHKLFFCSKGLKITDPDRSLCDDRPKPAVHFSWQPCNSATWILLIQGRWFALIIYDSWYFFPVNNKTLVPSTGKSPYFEVVVTQQKKCSIFALGFAKNAPCLGLKYHLFGL